MKTTNNQNNIAIKDFNKFSFSPIHMTADSAAEKIEKIFDSQQKDLVEKGYSTQIIGNKKIKLLEENINSMINDWTKIHGQHFTIENKGLQTRNDINDNSYETETISIKAKGILNHKYEVSKKEFMSAVAAAEHNLLTTGRAVSMKQYVDLVKTALDNTTTRFTGAGKELVTTSIDRFDYFSLDGKMVSMKEYNTEFNPKNKNDAPITLQEIRAAQEYNTPALVNIDGLMLEEKVNKSSLHQIIHDPKVQKAFQVGSKIIILAGLVSIVENCDTKNPITGEDHTVSLQVLKAPSMTPYAGGSLLLDGDGTVNDYVKTLDNNGVTSFVVSTNPGTGELPMGYYAITPQGNIHDELVTIIKDGKVHAIRDVWHPDGNKIYLGSDMNLQVRVADGNIGNDGTWAEDLIILNNSRYGTPDNVGTAYVGYDVTNNENDQVAYDALTHAISEVNRATGFMNANIGGSGDYRVQTIIASNAAFSGNAVDDNHDSYAESGLLYLPTYKGGYPISEYKRSALEEVAQSLGLSNPSYTDLKFMIIDSEGNLNQRGLDMIGLRYALYGSGVNY